MILIAFTAITASAQRGGSDRGMKNLSAEDQARMQTKKMTLALILDKAQAGKVYQLNLQQAKKRIAMKEEREKATHPAPTPEQRLTKREAFLDDRIALQNQMQKILNEAQFKQWRKMSHTRGKGKKGSRRGKHK